MPRIELKNVTKRWGSFYAVENLDLIIEDNSFVTLLGPSGCGKTTTLRMIAGLETPTSGRITIGDKVVFDSEKGINVPASKRKVGFLFQNYALWPNMTVYQNISFGLKNIKEELPIIDFEYQTNKQIIEALKQPQTIIDLINDCKDKKGKILLDRVYIKLIAKYIISMPTAKRLYALKIHECVDITKKAAEEIKKLEEENKLILEKHQKAGETLNENNEVCVNGEIIRKVRKLSKEEVDLAVRRVSRIVKVEMFMDRYPAELSGGQQQRVAIARTLAPEPTVLFMDEPLSNLDAKLRLEMRYELQRLHVETGSTFVYVTHDQMEAMTLATKICLINNGVLQQYDAPLKVYNYPNNTFVADFVGNPSINFLEANGVKDGDKINLLLFDSIKCTFVPNEVKDLDKWYKNRDEEAIKLEEAKKQKASEKNYVEKGNKDELFKYKVARAFERDEALEKEYIPVNGDFVIGIRPEFITIDENGKLEGEIHGAMPTGMETTLKIKLNDYLLTSVIFGGVIYPIGSKIRMNITGLNIMLFDRVSGKLIDDGKLVF